MRSMGEYVEFKASEKLKMWSIFIILLIAVVLYFSFPKNLLQNKMVLLFYGVAIGGGIIFAAIFHFYSSNRRVSLTAERVLIPYQARRSSYQSNTFSYESAGRSNGYWIFQFDRSNVKHATVASQQEIRNQKPKKFSFKTSWKDVSVIKFAYAYNDEKTVCIEFSEPLQFHSRAFINLFNYTYPPVDMIFVSVENPTRLVDELNSKAFEKRSF